MRPDGSWIVTVATLLTPSAAAVADYPACLAEALIRRLDVATVWVEFAPQISVFRFDVTGPDAALAAAHCRHAVEAAATSLGVGCEAWSTAVSAIEM